jgi:hypothetical protein
MICIFTELDGTNRLKFYYIDLFDAAIRSLQDPTLDGLLYHEFEMAQDSEGFRVFENINSGLVFESFYYLDVGAAPAILVVASDASFKGHMKQHPLYCKSDGIQL